jgi:hypothetical protein
MDRTELNNWIIKNRLTLAPDGQVYYTSVDGTDTDQFYFALDRTQKFITLPSGTQISVKSITKMKIEPGSFDLCTYTNSLKYTTAPQSVPIVSFDGSDTLNISMPKTDSDLNDLFPRLYPDYKSKLIYDVLREREMVDPSLFDKSLPEGKFVDFSENMEYKFYDDIERRLKDLGCTGMPPSTHTSSYSYIPIYFLFRRIVCKLFRVKSFPLAVL